jgi:hypothetical protein
MGTVRGYGEFARGLKRVLSRGGSRRWTVVLVGVVVVWALFLLATLISAAVQ